VQGDERRYRVAFRRKRELPHEREAVACVKFDVFASCRQHDATTNFKGHRALSNLPTAIMPVPPCGEVGFVPQDAVGTPSHNMRDARSYL